jgi:hypothetical protein
MQTLDPCLKANGFFFLKTMGMGNNGQVGTGYPFAIPTCWSSHAIVMCQAEEYWMVVLRQHWSQKQKLK